MIILFKNFTLLRIFNYLATIKLKPMNFFIQIKELGKRKPRLKNKAIELATLSADASLEVFIKLLVQEQLAAFNERKKAESLLPFLDNGAIIDGMEKGKVSFGQTYNDTTNTPEEAINIAIQAFKDGLYAIFVDDEQKEKLDNSCDVKAGSVVTFIRLTFLSGGWF
jgi:hypothetical protein